MHFSYFPLSPAERSGSQPRFADVCLDLKAETKQRYIHVHRASTCGTRVFTLSGRVNVVATLYFHLEVRSLLVLDGRGVENDELGRHVGWLSVDPQTFVHHSRAVLQLALSVERIIAELTLQMQKTSDLVSV